jgi:uncharacterized protein
VKLLADSNIVLEILLRRDKAPEAKELVDRYAEHEIYLSDFSLHSIGQYLVKGKRVELFRRFLEDIIINEFLSVISVPAEETGSVISVATRFNLDFDDAYQYTLAEKYGLTIVSFDKDFDRTERGRKTPAEVLAETE